MRSTTDSFGASTSAVVVAVFTGLVVVPASRGDGVIAMAIVNTVALIDAVALVQPVALIAAVAFFIADNCSILIILISLILYLPDRPNSLVLKFDPSYDERFKNPINSIISC
jgi:hypothetical protein